MSQWAALTATRCSARMQRARDRRDDIMRAILRSAGLPLQQGIGAPLPSACLLILSAVQLPPSQVPGHPCYRAASSQLPSARPPVTGAQPAPSGHEPPPRCQLPPTCTCYALGMQELTSHSDDRRCRWTAQAGCRVETGDPHKPIARGGADRQAGIRRSYMVSTHVARLTSGRQTACRCTRP
jgi:hypothetical protein